MERYVFQIMLWLNVCLFVLLTAVKFSRKVHVQAIVAAWSVTMLGVSLLLAHQVGASGMMYEVLGLNLPWFSVAPVSLSVALMTGENSRFASLRVPVAFIICAFYSLLGGDAYILPLANQDQADWVLLLAMFLTVSSFFITVLSPLAFFWNQEITLGQALFRASVQHVREHWRVLLKGLGWFVLAYFVTNVWAEGKILKLYFITELGTFTRHALYTTFFLVLLRHFVCIALAKYAIDALFPAEKTTMWEVLVFGCLLAGLQSYLPIALIVREFLFGLIFGYWYLKTRSLTYGIFVRSLSLIFT